MRNETGDQVSGVLLFLSQAAVHLLEGPTELLFKALDLLHSFSMDAAPPVVNPKERVRRGSTQVPCIGPVRVLYFTELHAIRVAKSWCTYYHASKAQGASQVPVDENNSAELAFGTYKKVIQLCLRAGELFDEGDAVEKKQTATGKHLIWCRLLMRFFCSLASLRQISFSAIRTSKRCS